MEMTETSLFALRKALDNKEISAVELTKAYLARIEKADGQLQSFITVTADRALADAQAAQKIIDRVIMRFRYSNAMNMATPIVLAA